MARTKRSKSSFISDRFDSLRATLLAGNGRFSQIASIVVLFTGVVLLWWGVPKLRERIDRQNLAATAVGNGVVDFVSAPAWFDSTRRTEVTNRVAMACGEGSALDPHRLAKARAALLSTGWFRSVEQVRLADDGGFLVEATFVQPFAVVRHGEFDYLIDESGRLLPMQWAAGHRPAEPHYVALVGTSEPNRGDFGTVWPGADMAAGLELAKLLASKPWFAQVAAIDLSQFGTDGTLSLITSSNGRLVWGRPPNDRTVAEVTPDAKLRTLDYLYARQRRIDSGGGRIIDLRGDLVTVRADQTGADGATEARP